MHRNVYIIIGVTYIHYLFVDVHWFPGVASRLQSVKAVKSVVRELHLMVVTLFTDTKKLLIC